MKKVILLTLWNLALSTPMFYVVSCGPSKEEIEFRDKETTLESKGKKYKIADIVYLKPDSCKAVVLRYKVNHTSWNENEDKPTLSYMVRDCHGKELQIDDDNFIYGKEN